ncbi:MAG: hypothetical protein ACRCUU_06490 [Plesiomonas sp.]
MLKVIDFQRAMDELNKELDKFRGGKHVTVGIHEAAGNVESGEITMAQLGAILDMGADIDHPGGTSYGYASKAASERNEVRFLKKGKGYMEIGVTAPHRINIPARPWLVPGVESATPELTRIIQSGITAGENVDTILNKVGLNAQAAVQMYMTELRTPPNAPSTIAQKGSDNPLIDTGALRASVTYVVQSGDRPTDEGL